MKSLALPLTRWWSRSDSSPNSAKAALPMELWYTIIREMTDKDLLQASAVCSAFNAFAISEYLARNNISTAAKEITGPAYIIHPLQLSCIPPPVEHLVCHFRPYDIRRDLLSLQWFVPRAQSLRDLELSFAGSLLHAHHNDRIPVEYSARELMGIFCRVLSGMASKAAGPVVVVGQFAMFAGRAPVQSSVGAEYAHGKDSGHCGRPVDNDHVADHGADVGCAAGTPHEGTGPGEPTDGQCLGA
ncbi:hypothetical protein C8F04DRAFT_1126051 [Mycena alexandri]|uniref:F-box domain-containing protein n=1 Tax=Mycena alexandri TaxID=1745969 RepID=A0AAD6SIR8_9AGAR|nr:hypothetical protein C8F04DRAFT_1126051 [Mycena alexandri]